MKIILILAPISTIILRGEFFKQLWRSRRWHGRRRARRRRRRINSGCGIIVVRASVVRATASRHSQRRGSQNKTNFFHGDNFSLKCAAPNPVFFENVSTMRTQIALRAASCNCRWFKFPFHFWPRRFNFILCIR